jgi:hypothetical protein
VMTRVWDEQGERDSTLDGAAGPVAGFAGTCRPKGSLDRATGKDDDETAEADGY